MLLVCRASLVRFAARPQSFNEDAVVVVENCGYSGKSTILSGLNAFTARAAPLLKGCQ